MREGSEKKSALVLTLGQQDLQVLYDLNGKPYRARPRKDAVRCFTKAIHGGRLEFELVSMMDSSAELAEETGEIARAENDRDGKFCILKNNLVVQNLDASTKIKIFLPMVSKAVKKMLATMGEDEKLENVLVIFTQRRDEDFHAKNEPYGVFDIIKPLISRELQIEESAITPVNIIEAGDIKVLTHDSLQTINQQAARRIFQGAEFLKNNALIDRVYCSYRSGIPEVTRAVLELILYWFEGNFVDVSSSEDGNKLQTIISCPIETVKAGRKIKNLVDSGEFESAAILARSYLHETHPMAGYLKSVHEIFVNGQDSDNTSLNDRKITGVLKNFLIGGDFPATLRTIFRLEHYLIRMDYANALRAIFTLVDILGWEFINKTFSDKPKKKFVNLSLDLLFPKNARSALTKFDLLARWPELNSDQLMIDRKLKPRGSDRYEDKRFPLDICLSVLKNEKISQLAEILKPKNPEGKIAQRTRNSAVHGCINHDDLAAAFRYLENKKLFNKSAGIVSLVGSDFFSSLIRGLTGLNIEELFNEFHSQARKDIDELCLSS